MGIKLSPPDLELYQRVDEVLHYIWDPIGVSGIPTARNEYYGYLPEIFGLLKKHASPEPIVEYLFELSTGHMGLDGRRKKDIDVAAILLNWKAAITEKYVSD